jgi:hypothetical protein
MVSPAFLVNASISPQWWARILQEKAALFGLVTAPKRRPKTGAAIVILRHAASRRTDFIKQSSHIPVRPFAASVNGLQLLQLRSRTGRSR